MGLVPHDKLLVEQRSRFPHPAWQGRCRMGKESSLDTDIAIRINGKGDLALNLVESSRTGTGLALMETQAGTGRLVCRAPRVISAHRIWLLTPAPTIQSIDNSSLNVSPWCWRYAGSTSHEPDGHRACPIGTCSLLRGCDKQDHEQYTPFQFCGSG